MLEHAQKTLNFELVSPEEKLISDTAWQVVVPGEEGNLGVMAGHSSWIVSVRPGVVEFHKNQGDEPQKIFVAGGFADISATNCTVLAEQAINVNELDEDQLKQELRDLNEDLTLVEGDADRNKVERAIVITKAKLSAVTGRLVV